MSGSCPMALIQAGLKKTQLLGMTEDCRINPCVLNQYLVFWMFWVTL